MNLTLDLIELADLVHPEQLVDEIVKQNPSLEAPIPLEDLARLAGISRIEAFASEGFAGMLLSNSEKSDGAIFYNSNDARPRQRFTIGHELGHFLLPWHRQSTFECSSKDLSFSSNIEWEIQANRFSAELLMPRALVMKQLRLARDPDIFHIKQLAKQFETSIEMTARRYVELNEYPCAVIFSKANKVRYSTKSEFFEHRLSVHKGADLPKKSPSRGNSQVLEDWDEIESYWWLDEQRGSEMPESVYEQTLVQENGFKITLLTLD